MAGCQKSQGVHQGVHSGPQRKNHVGATEAGSIAIFVMTKWVLKTFQRGSGRILMGTRGGMLRNDHFGDTLREQVFPSVVEVVGGNDVSRLTAHGFRHYFVSGCANTGVPQLAVMS